MCNKLTRRESAHLPPCKIPPHHCSLLTANISNSTVHLIRRNANTEYGKEQRSEFDKSAVGNDAIQITTRSNINITRSTHMRSNCEALGCFNNSD